MGKSLLIGDRVNLVNQDQLFALNLKKNRLVKSECFLCTEDNAFSWNFLSLNIWINVLFVCIYFFMCPESCTCKMHLFVNYGLSWWLSGKESSCKCRRHKFYLWVWKTPGEGNGNTLQYSCLSNSVYQRAWWATVHGVTRVRQDLATKQLWIKFKSHLIRI